MDTVDEASILAKSFVKLDLNQKFSSTPAPSKFSGKSLFRDSNQTSPSRPTTSESSGPPFERKKTPSLVSLCLGVVGKHLEDIIPDLDGISANFPSDVKLALAAIAKRRNLLDDDVIISLADGSWAMLDVSGSEVSDFGLAEVAKTCKYLRAVDIRGCPRSDDTARRCLDIFKPRLNDIEGDSWEELDTAEIANANGAQSLRWLVWPKIDKDSMETFSTECPRITVNPKASPFGLRGTRVPREALPITTLDEAAVMDIDPKAWAATRGHSRTPFSSSNASELSVAEKFRLAFEERDTRLAPKRAKNARQHQRRAEREWMTTSTRAKALALASHASKTLLSRS